MTENLAASIKARLLNQARESNRPFNDLLQLYGIERFLYRLSCSPHSKRFLLKGALALLALGIPIQRPTRDIDLLGYTSNAVEDILQVMQEVCIQEVEPDGIVFDAKTARGQRIKEEADYEGVRVHLVGWLGEARIPVQIDIGFADIVSPAAVTLEYPTLLPLPAPHLRGYPPEAIVAEKAQALVVLGSINSRMKDFYDLWVLAGRFDFDGPVLQAAIAQTFQHRNTPLPRETPVGLADAFAHQKQAQWQAFLKRTRLEQTVPGFEIVIQSLRAFLLPLLNSEILPPGSVWTADGRWEIKP